MHVHPSWKNKLLFLLVIKAQWTELLMNARLAALVKHVAELRKVGLKVCHCVEKFYLW
jgi:hypothetical protein